MHKMRNLLPGSKKGDKTTGKSDKKKKVSSKDRPLAEFSDDSETEVKPSSYSCAGGSSCGITRYTTEKPSTSASKGKKTEDKQSQKPLTMADFTAKKPSWAEVASNKQKQPSFSASSRTDSMSSTVPDLPDPMVPISSRTQLRRLSSAGRPTEPETKPEDPLIVPRHSKIAIGCAVKVRVFHEKGVVRWLGLYSDKCIAGLEMERAKSFWNKTQDDKSWFTCRADHEHYENIEELELMEPEKPSNFANRLYQSSMSSAPTSLTRNKSRVVELTETNDGRIWLGSKVRHRHLRTRGVVRWIGIYDDREMIGLETAEKTFGTTKIDGCTFFEAPEGYSEYLPSDRVEPDIESWQNPLARDDYSSTKYSSHTPGVHTSAVHPHTSSSSRSAVPNPTLVIVELQKFGDYSIGDHVLYKDVYPGIIKFMGRVKTKNGDEDTSKVHVGLDMTELMPPHCNNETFDGFSQFASAHHGAVYCDITQISHHQEIRSDQKDEDNLRKLSERRTSDTRGQSWRNVQSSIAEEPSQEPSSEDASPEAMEADDDDEDLYQDSRLTRSVSESRECTGSRYDKDNYKSSNTANSQYQDNRSEGGVWIQKDKSSERNGAKAKSSARDGGKVKASARDVVKDKLSERDGAKDKLSERDGAKDKSSARDGAKDKSSARDRGKDKSSERDGGKDKSYERNGAETTAYRNAQQENGVQTRSKTDYRNNADYPRSNADYPRSNADYPRSNTDYFRSYTDYPRSYTDHYSRRPLRDLKGVKQIQKYQDLEVNAMVETVGQRTVFGVIKWIGYLPTIPDKVPLVGIEMEEDSYLGRGRDDREMAAQRFGEYDGYKLFACTSGRGAFFGADRLRKDRRFEDFSTPDEVQNMYEMPKSGIVQENQCVAYWPRRSEHVLGRFKGIQGHHNSCYLDATLYSMFAFTHAFDSVLHRPKLPSDIAEYTEIQTILREKIVNPLRRDHYVDAQKVMELRTLLDKLSSVSGMMGEEKDPEEFLNSLLNETLKADPFIKLSSGQEAFLYQLFLENTENITQPTTEELINMSFEQSKIKLKEAPSCLIVQMPRFGRNYKMFDKIVPSPEIDITKLIERPEHKCSLCFGENPEWYTCVDCGMKKKCAVDYCHTCWREHQQSARHQDHRGYLVSGAVDEQMMELFSVVCIETSHYVTFTKCAPQKWVFFDSMADRIGDQHGFNIPEVVISMDVGESSEMLHFCNDVPLARRVLQDAYLCFYRSVNTSMYC